MTCGVYQITCTENGKFYIGSSVDIEQRWDVHKSMLNSKTHKNPNLQNSWNKYGPSAFVFTIIEKVQDSQRVSRELYWYKKLGPQFNAMVPDESLQYWEPGPETRARLSAANRGRIATPETRAKLSAANKVYWSKPESRAKQASIAKAWMNTPEGKAKLSAATKKWEHTPEGRIKMSAATSSWASTSEGRAKLSASAKRRANTPEGRKQMSINRRGNKQAEEK